MFFVCFFGKILKFDLVFGVLLVFMNLSKKDMVFGVLLVFMNLSKKIKISNLSSQLN